MSDSTSSFELITINGCVCPGGSVTLQCSVTEAGVTVWGGSAFDCMSSSNVITLLHSRFNSTGGTNGTCNNGTIVGKSIGVKNNHYTSRLYVRISSDLVGKDIECIRDNGTKTEKVGEHLLLPTGNGTGTIIARI